MIKKLIKVYAPKPLTRILTKIYGLIIYRSIPKHIRPLENTDSYFCTIAYNKYGGYCLPKNSIDRPAAQTTMRGGVWEEETIQFITRNCKGGDIIHAGTYFGDFLPALSINCDEESKIWAFEPIKEHYNCASITLLLNKIENVNLSHAGLGNINKPHTMMVKDEDGRSLGGGSLVIGNQENIDSESIESIDIVCLDEHIPKDRSISIIHLDIEGFEQQALEGAMMLIKKNLPVLILETLPDNNWLRDHLFSIGYKVEREILGNTILENHQ